MRQQVVICPKESRIPVFIDQLNDVQEVSATASPNRLAGSSTMIQLIFSFDATGWYRGVEEY